MGTDGSRRKHCSGDTTRTGLNSLTCAPPACRMYAAIYFVLF